MEARSSDAHSSISLIVKGRLFGFALKHIFAILLSNIYKCHLNKFIFQRVSSVILERASTSSSSSLPDMSLACSWSIAPSMWSALKECWGSGTYIYIGYSATGYISISISKPSGTSGLVCFCSFAPRYAT